MHDCLKAREDLVELLFGGAAGPEHLRLLAEVEGCGPCGAELRSLESALGLFDFAAGALMPAESFWTGYDERLRRRMTQVLPLNANALARGEYQLTLLDDEGLLHRLAARLRDVARESQLTWPAFRESPLDFVRRFVSAYAAFFWQFISQRNVALGTSFSFVLLFIVIGGVIGLERLRLSNTDELSKRSEYEVVYLPTNSNVPDPHKEKEAGAPGMSKGDGGGSGKEKLRPQGGGGGGLNELKPASQGKTPPGQLQTQIVTPSPYAPTVKNPSLPVLTTLDADPLLFPPDYRPIPFGDPKSSSKEISAGPGSNGGIGTGENGGIGSGNGGGFGPGREGNTGGGSRQLGTGGPGGDGGTGGTGEKEGDGILNVKEVTRRAVLVSKPEPGFTEEARKAGITGTVKLRLALRANGTVSDITVVKGLPGGLTERALNAASRIQFVPAQKNGRNVSQWVTVEYNFNIY